MYKLVVLSVLLALAVAEPEPKPGTFIAPLPISPYANVVVPASTTITKQASSILHPSPFVYNTPVALTHFIKKRSAPLTYIAPSYAAPLAATYNAPIARPPLFASPFVAPLPYVAATHLIKKRSAPFLPTTYITPTTYAASTPLLASTYTTTPLLSSPLIPSTPIISSPVTHFIKKRSAPFVSLTPTAYSQQSRIDLQSTPVINTQYTYPLPASPIAYSHVF
ncbi:uncharacterized protein LOC113521464 [Galleria mellonella]|uniref:Uncharacterized protein LOC113521464 n=1 Tax=Galleria mellonella TaxID=7137 RepID=A0A6J1X157_GALME|nr:uncharacterized protein LOC113521464 [Galleria mellonella]